MDKVIGIDLGTFNSCVAVVENGTPVVVANRGGPPAWRQALPQPTQDTSQEQD